ncbi:MAG: protein translocase subunit SecF [Candidatus Mycalebacterium zealandia]|nr:MAG: protein translocase subunit SecF [Candidatus Mycalebacterium zealandia]
MLLVTACFAAIVMDGGPRPGVEFTGGTEVHIKAPASGHSVMETEVRRIFTASGYEPVSVQRFGIAADKEFLVKFTVNELSSEKVNAFKTSFTKTAGESARFAEARILRIDYIGPNVGKEFVKKAVIALLLGCVAVLLYLIFRFELGYATGAVAALVHDVVITMGFLAFTDKEITLSIVAALLMVVGYSVNDTIVIFDRIRETLDTEDESSSDFITAVNTGISRTLSRTILTTITVFIVLIPLFFLGGAVIHDFAFTLMVGVIAGTYSSIFVATYFVVRMRKRNGAMT